VPAQPLVVPDPAAAQRFLRHRGPELPGRVLILADEVSRREAKSASLRARAAGLDPRMRLDTWDQAEMRRLTGIQLLIIDDLALQRQNPDPIKMASDAR
jgi:hypothetical protein